MLVRSFVILFCLSFVFCTKAQVLDSTRYVENQAIKTKNPRKAATLSAIAPGAGQIYNEKYWKLPIIYGGIAALVYSASYNWSNYQSFRDAYIAKEDDDTTTIDPFPFSSSAAVQQQYRSFRSNFELSIIGIMGIYLLNIVDATVDAHLYEFNVNDDLSMKIQPAIKPRGVTGDNLYALSVTLKLRK